jgi:hypothetical protein
VQRLCSQTHGLVRDFVIRAIDRLGESFNDRITRRDLSRAPRFGMNALAVLHFCPAFGGPSDRRRNVKPSTSLPRLQPVKDPEAYLQACSGTSARKLVPRIGCGESRRSTSTR